MPSRPDPGVGEMPRPADFNALRAAIGAKHAMMPKRLADVARYVLNDPDDIALSSVAEIATTARVTPSTLTRFAQFFGYDGFAALQDIFREAVRRKIAEGSGYGDPRGIGGNDGFRDAIVACHHCLDALSSSIAIADIHAAARVLSRAGCIFIVARGAAFPMAALFHQSLARLKIRSTLLADVPGGNESLAFATPGDAAFIVSYAPEADEMIALVTALSGRNVPFIAVTDTSLSPLSKSASICFSLIGPGHNDRLANLAAIALNEILAITTQKLREKQ